MGKDATSLTSPQNKTKGVLTHIPGVLFLNVTLHLNPFREEHSLPSKTTHYCAAIVMTMNDIYDMIQKFQNAFSGLITATNLRTTYCHPHFTGKHVEKLRDLSKDVEIEVRFSDVKVHTFLVWNISKHNKSTNSYKEHAGTRPGDHALASELPSLWTVSLMSRCSLSCTMIYHSEEDQMSPPWCAEFSIQSRHHGGLFSPSF